MKRKDCGNISFVNAREGAGRLARSTRFVVLIALAVGSTASALQAGSIRLWPAAVVVEQTVHLADLAEFKNFNSETERLLAGLVVTETPSPGGSRIIHMDLIRSVLVASGTNMAAVTLSGAIQCAITKPANPVTTDQTAESALPTGGRRERAGSVSTLQPASHPSTLRQAVTDYFNAELARYDGRANLVFDRTSEQVLDLSEPAYQFRVRRRSGALLGLIQLEVDVLAGGRTVQTVPLVVRASMMRRVVVARRGINQGATIKPSDVEAIPLSFTRLGKLGIGDAARVIGQRAKRFISAGSLIDPDVLESVPLVTRGQLVTLTSVAGAVKAVTTAKAMGDGLLGETITVRAADNKRVEFDAVVVGPGAVLIGSGNAVPANTTIALGGAS